MTTEETPERPEKSVQTPALGRGVPTPAKVAVDAMPFDRTALAQMSPEQRSAIYLNQIRKMLIFFTVLAVIGVVGGVVIGIAGIAAIHHAQTCTGFGC